ncbi:hypothetical protein [Nocardia macrotermitis]|uniref:Uncharacterized protein n=1 Tax=Nocardia macrotermitis TaxID=2585198 RepID=A0A7K0D0U8_9NOCA|nr:hypothetical protein [Nocardia macrotermitis]MQY18564.1 hypothetical protein [Nocardia macrotermitis]
MDFYQATPESTHPYSGFMELDDSERIRDMGPDSPSRWTPPEIEISTLDEWRRPLRPAKVLRPSLSCLAIYPKDREEVEEYLLPWGEFLPAVSQGEPLLLFHATHHADVAVEPREEDEIFRRLRRSEPIIFHRDAEELGIFSLTSSAMGLFFSQWFVDRAAENQLFDSIEFRKAAIAQ